MSEIDWRERAERAEKEAEELRRKWEQRHMDLEIVAAYDSGKASGEKERDELAAQVVVLKNHLRAQPMYTNTAPPIDKVVCLGCATEFDDDAAGKKHPDWCPVQKKQSFNLHPAATRLVERLRLLEELRQMVEDFNCWTETATNLRKEVFCHDPKELDKLKAKAVEAARGKE